MCLIFVFSMVINVFAGNSLSELDYNTKPSWCRRINSSSVSDGVSTYWHKYSYYVDDYNAENFASFMGTLADTIYIEESIGALASDNGVSLKGSNVVKVELGGNCSKYNSHFIGYFIADDVNITSSDIYFRVDYIPYENISDFFYAYNVHTNEKISGQWFTGYCVDNTSDYVTVDNCPLYMNCPKVGTSNDYSLSILSSSAPIYYHMSHDDIVNGVVSPSNPSDLVPKKYGVLEVPKELSVSGGSSNSGFNLGRDDTFTLHWTQTDETYKQWETEILVYADLGVKNVLLPWTDYYKVEDFYLYSDIVKTKYLKWEFDREKMVSTNPLWIAEIEKGLGYSGGTYESLFKLTIMMRNKYYDGTYTYYSNWLEVVFDDDGMAGTVNNNAIPTEKEYDDPYNGDSDTDFTQQKPNGATNPDSEYQGQVIEGDKGALSGLTEALSNGFGLMGEGGILDMVGDFFSFVPSWIWSLIGTSVAMACIIFLIKIVI